MGSVALLHWQSRTAYFRSRSIFREFLPSLTSISTPWCRGFVTSGNLGGHGIDFLVVPSGLKKLAGSWF